MTPLYAAVDMHTLGWMQGRPAPKPSGELDSVAIVKALLARGANPNAQLKAPLQLRAHATGDASLGAGATPFMRAAKWGDLTLMRLLLDSGANPTIRQKNHTTALMLAFHRKLRQGLAKDEALREAMALVRQNAKTAHPYYWAAFFLTGDPN